MPRNIRALIALASLLAPAAHACVPTTKPIAVGGVDGFASLANPANTTILRASCEISLYIHDYIWTRLPPGHGTRRKILQIFKTTGPAVLELGASPDAAAYFGPYYRHNYTAHRVVAHIANINGAENLTLPQWKAYVAAARTDGLKILALDWAPNGPIFWHHGKIDRKIWNRIKHRAAIGGGLTVDAPPSFFFSYTPDYRRFVVHEIQWTKAHHLLSTLIISPNVAGIRFLADTQQMIAYLKARHALPDHYIVENYAPLPVPKHLINLVGAETDSRSITGVALWLLTTLPRMDSGK